MPCTDVGWLVTLTCRTIIRYTELRLICTGWAAMLGLSLLTRGYDVNTRVSGWLVCSMSLYVMPYIYFALLKNRIQLAGLRFSKIRDTCYDEQSVKLRTLITLCGIISKHVYFLANVPECHSSTSLDVVATLSMFLFGSHIVGMSLLCFRAQMYFDKLFRRQLISIIMPNNHLPAGRAYTCITNIDLHLMCRNAHAFLTHMKLWR